MGRGPHTGLLACAACGVDLPSGAKFCHECGTSVSRALTRESRRTVTLLFSDVTGSTAMGEVLDPEAYRGVMGRYFDVARAAVERHGGTVEKFVGDAVLAVFGVPEIHEDDALRAVRAASELRAAVADLSADVWDEMGVRLAIRIGVNTGSVVTGSARAGGSFATGDAVNTAARLEQAAGDGEVLIGTSTFSLVRDAVEVEPAGAMTAKGKAEPVPAYRLLRVLDIGSGRRRREDVPLVGRSFEARALDDIFDRALTSGRSHMVTVIGPPGIGKSRLVTEFLSRIGGRAAIARGRCVSYGQGITYWPLVQALRDVLGLTGTESNELTRHALEQATDRAPDRDAVVGLLMPLLGRSGSSPGQEQTFWSVGRLLEELAARKPLVVNIDDLHWAEPTLLELLEHVRDDVSDLPLLLICQARPELLERHPGWGAGVLNSMILGLDPLTATETTASLVALLHGEPPDRLGEAVVEWSGGNPLFVEEIVAHLVESGVLEREHGGAWRLRRSLDRTTLPPTVAAVLASRLDRLPRAERELLERASVIGLEFRTAQAERLVEEVSVPGVPALLEALARRDVVRRVRSSEGDAWTFKHILVREAAYDAMAKSLRSELHERFADGLGSSDEHGPDPGFAAHHLEQAARYRRELAAGGPHVEALVDRAVDHLILAADNARDGDRYHENVAYLGRALGLRPATSATRRRILARLAFRHFEHYDLNRCAETLTELEQELDETADVLDTAYLSVLRGAQAMAAGRDISPFSLSEQARALVELGRAAGDDGAVVVGLRTLLECAHLLGLWQDHASYIDEIIRIGSPADVRAGWAERVIAKAVGDAPFRDVREAMRQRLDLVGHSDKYDLNLMFLNGIIAAAECSSDAAEVIAAAASRAAELEATGTDVGDAVGFLADSYALLRDLDAAIDCFQQTNDGLRAVGDTGHASTSILEQAMLMLERRDNPAGVGALIDEAAANTSPYDAESVALLAGCRAILALRGQEPQRAVELTDQALRTIDGTHALWLRADLRRRLSELPRVLEDADRERELLMEARELYRRKEIRSYDNEIDARLGELDDEGSAIRPADR